MGGKKTHGLSKHPLYRVWMKIKDRLYNPKHEAYHLYGGRGVVMCDLWLSHPENFVQWALDNGWVRGMHIDKDIKAYKLGVEAIMYSPEMCSVVTPRENCSYTSYNRRIQYNGKEQTLQEWCNELKIDQATLHHRLYDMKWSVKDAFTKSTERYKLVLSHDGREQTIDEWVAETGISKSTIRNRLSRGWTVPNTLTIKPIKGRSNVNYGSK